jgi:hypothetical protein
MLTAAITLTGCSSSNDSELEALKKENEELKAQLEELQNSSDETTANNTITDSTNNEEEDTTAEVQEISLNETIVIDDIMEFTFTSAEWLDSIEPSDSEKAYSHIPESEGIKYFCLKGTFKNLATQKYSVDIKTDVNIIINDKYENEGTMKCETNKHDAFSGVPKPLETLNLICYAGISDELYNECKTVQVKIECMNDTENLDYHLNTDSMTYNTYILNLSK